MRESPEFKEFLELYQKADLLELGRMADAERWRKHPDPVVTYIVDRNINYTNVCVADCGFCAFARRPRHGEGYVLSYEQIGLKIDECKAQGGVQILLQGGHNPYIPFEWYLELMRYIKRNHPIHIHGFSPSDLRKSVKRDARLPDMCQQIVAIELPSFGPETARLASSSCAMASSASFL